MLFVLAVMLLLLAIGSSVLVSASANAGAGLSRHAINQLNIYAESIQKSIMYSLQLSGSTIDGDVWKNISDTINSPETLGGQILGTIYKDAISSPSDEIILNITPAIADTDLSAIKDIEIRIVPYVHITPFEPEQSAVLDEDGNSIFPAVSRQPQTAAVSAEVTVTVTAEYRERAIVSVVTYDYSGGFLKDNNIDKNQMLIADAGNWRFVSHEKVDK